MAEGSRSIGGELDALIERRSRQFAGEAEQARRAIWRESAEKYRRASEQDRLHEWSAFHTRMAELHSSLSDEHAQEAAKLAGTEDTDLG